MSTHRTLVIGVAGRGQVWAGLLKAHPGFDLVGIADLDAEALKKCGEAVGLPPAQWFRDYKEVLGTGEYDTAVVAASTVVHYTVTRDVLNAGAHCLVEKPFTLDMAEAVELVELAEARGLILEVVQNYRFDGICRFIERALRVQRLGRLSAAHGRFHRHRPRRDHERNFPYPLLFIQVIHHLDWLTAILPSAISNVQALHGTPEWSSWEGPSMCNIMMKCADGVLVSYQGSYNSQGDISNFGGRWRFECERGDLVWDENDVVWEITGCGERREKVYEVTPDEKSGDEWLLDTWHEGMTEGVEPPTSGRRNLRTLKLLFDIVAADGAPPAGVHA